MKMSHGDVVSDSFCKMAIKKKQVNGTCFFLLSRIFQESFPRLLTAFNLQENEWDFAVYTSLLYATGVPLQLIPEMMIPELEFAACTTLPPPI